MSQRCPTAGELYECFARPHALPLPENRDCPPMTCRDIPGHIWYFGNEIVPGNAKTTSGFEAKIDFYCHSEFLLQLPYLQTRQMMGGGGKQGCSANNDFTINAPKMWPMHSQTCLPETWAAPVPCWRRHLHTTRRVLDSSERWLKLANSS